MWYNGSRSRLSPARCVRAASRERDGFVMPKGIHPRKLRPVEQRFWGMVEKRGEDECWPWTGTSSGGYGNFEKRPAHRWAYEMMVGPIPIGLEPDHLCRTRICVNPKHLELVTHKENVLRGDGLTAQNASKTHCLYGHPFDPLNTYHKPVGGRGCRTCMREKNRQWRKRVAALEAKDAAES